MPARLPDVPEEVAQHAHMSVDVWESTVLTESIQRGLLRGTLRVAVQTYGLSAVARAIGWPRQRLHAFIGKGDRA